MKKTSAPLRIASIAFLTLFLAGCTVVPGISDLDKFQPSVTLSATYTGFDKIDWDAGAQKAKEQCAKLGYEKARALERAQSSCVTSNQYGCLVYQDNLKFVCEN